MFLLGAFVVFIGYFQLVTNVELPKDLKKCKLNSDNEALSKCLLDAMNVLLPKLRKGLPEFDLEASEPLKIKNMTIGEGTGIVHVVQNYKDILLHNILTLRINKVSASHEKQKLKLKVDTVIDYLKLNAMYNLNGSILVLPVYGNGRVTVDLYNVKLGLKFAGKPYQKKDVTYFSFEDCSVDIQPKNLKYNFENLFNGNKILGNNINNILNGSPLEVFSDVKKGYESAFAGVFQNVVNSVVTKIPMNKLFLP